ncbi:MAG: phosphate ABC transporter ATP-binding protein PstB [Candidatus Geothermincolia bacterium]
MVDIRQNEPPAGRYKINIEHLDLYYGDFQALEDITMDIERNRITSFIGPSGCGKSTALRSINRMNDIIKGSRVSGHVMIEGADVYSRGYDVVELRKRVGMVFQRPNPFPKSIYENVAYGPRIFGVKDRATLDRTVEESLRHAALWDEVKDKMKQSALALSGGQQQRLCIARVLAVQPEVILLDEPAASLDPIATQRIEDLLQVLKRDYTIVIVTHNMQQAARLSDYTAFFMIEEQGDPGRLIEFGDTNTIFTKPEDERTERYITGRFG